MSVEDSGAVGEEVVPFLAMMATEERKEVEGDSERREVDGFSVAESDVLLRGHELRLWNPLSVVLVGDPCAGEAGYVGELGVGGGEGEATMEVSKLLDGWRRREIFRRDDDLLGLEGGWTWRKKKRLD